MCDDFRQLPRDARNPKTRNLKQTRRGTLLVYVVGADLVLEGQV